MWHFLTGAQYVPGVERLRSTPKQPLGHLYFHLLPDRAKALRDRLNAQEVNEVFSELLVRLNFALDQSGVTAKHEGMLTEYKSIRFLIARDDICIQEISKAVEGAIAEFEVSLQKSRPAVYELLKGTELTTKKRWIEFAFGETEFKAKLASSEGRHSFTEASAAVFQKASRLLELVKNLPSRLDSFEGLQLMSVPMGAQKTLAFELFEILRSSEGPQQLEDLLRARLQAPGIKPSEAASFSSVVRDLWDLRDLLKYFTPPNQYDHEEIAAFDDLKIEKVGQADRILSIDLKGVGARLSQELFQNLQKYIARSNANEDVLESIRIDQTVSWLKSQVQTARIKLREELGSRYVTDVSVGDEMIIYYRGSSIVESAAEKLGADFRVVDLQIRQAEEGQAFSVYAQSTLSMIGETASKIIERSWIGRLEPPPRVVVRLRIDENTEALAWVLVFEIHLMGVSELDRPAVECFMAEDFKGLMAAKAHKFAIWMNLVRFETKVHTVNSVSPTARNLAKTLPAALAMP